MDAGGQKSLELVIRNGCDELYNLFYSGSCVLVDGKPKLRVTTRPLKEDQLHDVLENSS